MKKFREWINIQLIKNPGRMVLAAILLFNVIFLLIASVVISNLSLDGTENMGFLEAAFCTVTMILDAGCIQFVVSDIGASGVAVVVVCLVIVFVGMISFTGAVIGYTTNYISNFIAHANAGARRLKISNHCVILNWNTRASEIVNDLLYCETKQRIVVLVSANKENVEKEINERLADTIARENQALQEHTKGMGIFARFGYIYKHRFTKNVSVIVREGDVFSSKQLHDISLEYARMIVILGNDVNNSSCKYEVMEKLDEKGKGNSQTVKTLMQVADITSASYSFDNQKIVVEITDDWTEDLVNKIIKYKQVDGKCNIVPVCVNRILGHILSQFSLMPELNLAYRELFSNKGATFFTVEKESQDEIAYNREYLRTHSQALPLTFMDSKEKSYCYYAANHEKDLHKKRNVETSDYRVKLNRDYWIERKNIIILGHNSRCDDIMQGFSAFRDEWGYKDRDDEIVRIVVIDNNSHLEKMNYYKDYPFVIETVAAEVYDRETIFNAVDRFISSNKEDTSVLILSDDTATNENIDATALANLVYVQDIIKSKKLADPYFDEESVDLVVEIINPKHHDIVNSYSVNNVVISNRYISKMITQICEKEALFDFYTDILTYDTGDCEVYESKEIYIKKVNRYFDEIPGKCNALELIRAVYAASSDDSLPPEKRNPGMVLGYVKPGGKIVLFSGEQSDINVELEYKDKLVIFSNH